MNTGSANATDSTLPHGRGARLAIRLVPTQFQGLVLQLREDWRGHFRDWTLPGFRAIAVYRFGKWVQAESGHGIVRGPFAFLARRLHLSMFRYVRNQYGIELPGTATVGRRVLIGHQSGIVIHPYATIGDDCVIRQNVTIGALTMLREEAPTIGNRVELGAGSTILGPVTIGDGARIGPHSVVMTDIPAGAMVFVNPPRVVVPRAGSPANGPTAVPASSDKHPFAAAR